MQSHACDACRRRKIRCDRNQPCAGCLGASLSCTFLAPTRPKGRSGATATVLSKIRASQIQSIQGSIAKRQDSGIISSTSVQAARTPGFLSLDTLEACIEFYFSQLYSSVPILERDMVNFDGDLLDVSDDLYCLILSFSAFIILQTGAVHSKPAGDGSLLSMDVTYGQSLLHEALESRRNSKPIVLPSIKTVITSFFFYACYRFLGDQSKAFFFLRESTTLYLSTQDEEVTSDLKDHPALAQLFWLLLVTERANAIRKHRPLTLMLSALTPSLSKLPGPLANSGFMYLVDLYAPFDEIFLGSWNGTSHGTSVESLLALERHLQKTVSVDLPDAQQADLLVSQQWLRLIVWQLSMKLGFLSATSTCESLTFRYPINIARDLSISTWAIPQQSMEIHGIGLVEKLFDICFQLIDVMSLTPLASMESQGMDLSPEDCLSYIFSLMSRLRGSVDRFLPLLQVKLNESLPNTANPLAQSPRLLEYLANSTSPPNLENQDGDYAID